VERLFGVETEYALGGERGVANGRSAPVLDALMKSARTQLATLPDELSRGVFLQNGARFYVDSGGHPEFTTPECSNPWDVVRYIRAGEAILVRLAGTLRGRRPSGEPAFFRSNVDYSGAGTTWGCHESYMHRTAPSELPKQLIPHLVSRVVYAGAGGFDNLSPGIQFTLSPRTSHLVRDVSHDSTTHRGIFHTKDEPLCGNGYHRLHLLCGESLCSDLGSWLKVGTTALVLALAEAGLRPGDDVQLPAPLVAMRQLAYDPSCTLAVPTTTGTRLTAIAIQRHYLGQAEAHVNDAFMPPWAAEVCRRWRAVLDRLADGWESAATSLDWAIKLALYKERARRRGVDWDALGTWNAVAGRLTTALRRARPLTMEVVRDPESPIADTVKRLGTSVLRERGLEWDGFGAFLELRNELFEIDTRFGQLGSEGIFSTLDAGGVLAHRVDGVDNVEHAIDNPPTVPRARLRGELVRTLTGHDGRYACDWDGVWDCENGSCVDLSDPFTSLLEWKRWPEGTEVEAPASVLAGMDWLRRRRRPRMPDPIALSDTARDHRMRDRLEAAETLFRRAIEVEDRQVPAASPKRPHRRNHLAVVLMRAGQLGEAARWNTEAWRLKAGQHDLVSGRILFVRIALRLLQGDTAVGLYLGQLKTLLGRETLECLGDIASTWEVPDVLAMLRARLPGTDADLLVEISETLNDRGRLPSLRAFAAWRAAAAVPLEAAWPEG